MPGGGRLLLFAVLALTVPACSGRDSRFLLPNHEPQVRLTSDPVSEPSPDAHSWHVYWVGDDADGRIDHYLVAVDPRSLELKDPAWTFTRSTDRVLTFRDAAHSSSLLNETIRHPHVFAVRAVDDRGGVSDVATRAFFLDNVAPEVRITNPEPSHLFAVLVGPAVHVRWTGSDPDGGPSGTPVHYKIKLLAEGNSEFDPFVAIQDPDSLRRFYAPRFAGWDSIPGDSTTVLLDELAPSVRYLFAIVAIDSVGDYDPVFSTDRNLLQFTSSSSGCGPTLSFNGEVFTYPYSGPLGSTDPSFHPRVEIPAGVPFNVRWSARPGPYTEIACYRWALDIDNVDDETPRSDEATDLAHWSRCAVTSTECSVGPYTGHEPGPSLHRLYVEAFDDIGCRTLGIVQFHVVAPPLVRKPLLIVNDTRLIPDQKLFFPNPASPDSLQNPPGQWPSRAELDTFLFAVGGFRWKYTPSTPAPTMSYPGLFAGYDFDTVYTRAGPFMNQVPLSFLVGYEHVIWISDDSGWNIANAPTTGINAMFTMSGPGMESTLAAYVSMGGSVWATGGGFCGSTMMNGWNRRENDFLAPALPRFSSKPFGNVPAELVPGRFMFDWAKWRSEIWCAQSGGPVQKSSRIPPDGSWTNTKYGVSCPPYSLLIDRIRQKSVGEPEIFHPDGTSRYPFRDYDVYNDVRAWPVEILPGNNNLSYTAGMGMGANRILEAIGAGQDTIVSTLDTLLYVAGGGSLPQNTHDLDDPVHFNENVVMTYYHGYESPPFLFSGFDLWSPARPDLIQLVDFVLQRVWDLPRANVDRESSAPRMSTRAAAIASLSRAGGPPPGGRGARVGSGTRGPAARR